MARPDLDVVTGAFSYTGRAIAEEPGADTLYNTYWVRFARYVSELARNFRPYDPL